MGVVGKQEWVKRKGEVMGAGRREGKVMSTQREISLSDSTDSKWTNPAC